MTTSSGHLQGALHTLLSSHIGKVEVEAVLMFVELLTGIDDGGLILFCPVHETDNVREVLHAIDVEIVDNSRLVHVVHGHNKALELLLTGTDSYGEGTADGFQLTVEAQFAYHHIV